VEATTLAEHPIFSELVAVPLCRRSGNESFHGDGVSVGRSVLSYWQWSASDLLSNTERGRLAEYIVAMALDVADGVRSGWEAYDIETSSGIRVEVKASAYVQTWGQKALSKIIFGIRPTRAWDSTTNVFAKDSQRQAKVYVFAVLAERNQTNVDPLNLAQWQFYVLPTSVLNERAPIQKTISLSSLLRMGALIAGYQELRDAVERASGDLPSAECK
jgi:hypothetical protein